MTNKQKKPDEEPSGYKDATGPIPLDHFGNDIPGNPVDTSPGSLYEHGMKLVDETKKKTPDKK